MVIISDTGSEAESGDYSIPCQHTAMILPPELLDKIVESLPTSKLGTETLLSLSLTSPVFVHPCRARVFRSLEINIPPDPPERPTRIQRLVDLLELFGANEQLPTYFRHVTYMFRWEDLQFHQPLYIGASAILERLPHIESFQCIWIKPDLDPQPLSWTSIPTPLRSTFTRILQSPLLYRLRFDSLADIPMSILLMSENLHTLEIPHSTFIFDCTFTSDNRLHHLKRLGLLCEFSAALTLAKYAPKLDMIRWLGTNVFQLIRLRFIQSDFQSTGANTNFSGLAEILSLCPVTSLDVRQERRSDKEVQAVKILRSFLAEMEKLTLKPFECKHSNVIARIKIRILLDSPTIVHLRQQFRDLDELLSQPTFEGLESIGIHFVFSQWHKAITYKDHLERAVIACCPRISRVARVALKVAVS